MKKKITYSLLNLFSDTQKEVEIFRSGFLTFSGTFVAYQYVQEHHQLCIILSMSFGLINWLLGGIRIEDVE